MELQDTVDMMNSKDYKERFKAEYWQLKIRADKLQHFIERFEAGDLNFAPSCPMFVHKIQLSQMRSYQTTLEERAKIEDVDLTIKPDYIAF